MNSYRPSFIKNAPFYEPESFEEVYQHNCTGEMAWFFEFESGFVCSCKSSRGSARDKRSRGMVQPGDLRHFSGS